MTPSFGTIMAGAEGLVLPQIARSPSVTDAGPWLATVTATISLSDAATSSRSAIAVISTPAASNKASVARWRMRSIEASRSSAAWSHDFAGAVGGGTELRAGCAHHAMAARAFVT